MFLPLEVFMLLMSYSLHYGAIHGLFETFRQPLCKDTQILLDQMEM